LCPLTTATGKSQGEQRQECQGLEWAPPTAWVQTFLHRDVFRTPRSQFSS
jgi:hypothetical protein